jgi:cold shock CspA family protein
MTGQITRVLRKGYGFILGDDDITRFFAARETYTPFDDLRDGMRVEYDEGVGNDKGARAVNVMIEGAE